MSEYKPMLVFLNEITQVRFSTLNIEWTRTNEYEVHHTNKSKHCTNSIQIDWILCEIVNAEVLLSCYSGTLNQAQLDQYQNVQDNNIYRRTSLNQIDS